jgi:hypothetical protein
MQEQIINIVVSPEVLSRDIFDITYDGYSFGSYSGLSQVLSGGTNGQSLLTGLTIPILFTQSYNDLGYYSPFDGFIEQQDVITNFVLSGNTTMPYTIRLYNSAGYNYNRFLELATYNVDWGDGLVSSTLNVNNPSLDHTYSNTPQNYTIKMTQNNPWGVTIIEKNINIPFTGVTVDNQLGNITFIPQGGNWSGIPISYDYIFTGDSENNINSQISSTYTQVPFVVSGYTNSRLRLLRRWGPNPYTVGYIQQPVSGVIGYVTEITSTYTAYTINNTNYYDLNNGKTLFLLNSSGLTSNDIVVTAITKNETLLDFVSDPEIQSDVFIERGKYSATENIQRLGEVDNLGDLVRYGYGYFKIINT